MTHEHLRLAEKLEDQIFSAEAGNGSLHDREEARCAVIAALTRNNTAPLPAAVAPLWDEFNESAERLAELDRQALDMEALRARARAVGDTYTSANLDAELRFQRYKSRCGQADRRCAAEQAILSEISNRLDRALINALRHHP